MRFAELYCFGNGFATVNLQPLGELQLLGFGRNVGAAWQFGFDGYFSSFRWGA